MDVNVEEKRTVVFEPGVTKTLFDSNWAGEVGFAKRRATIAFVAVGPNFYERSS